MTNRKYIINQTLHSIINLHLLFITIVLLALLWYKPLVSSLQAGMSIGTYTSKDRFILLRINKTVMVLAQTRNREVSHMCQVGKQLDLTLLMPL